MAGGLTERIITTGRRLLLTAGAGAPLLLLTGCFTGIESTQRIKMSKSDIKVSEPTAEQKYFADLGGTPLDEWQKGKPFYVSDPKLALMLIQRSLPADGSLPSRGDTVTYAGTTRETRPDGRVTAAVILASPKGNYLYDTGKSPETAGREFTSYDMATLIDLDALGRTRDRMKGKTFWTRTDLWYDDADNNLKGRKFVPVVIDSVTPGTMVFPIRVTFTDDRGVRGHYYMTPEGNEGASRRFAQLFYLRDVREQYPHIEPEVWTLIQEGKVRQGMTKDECRLSLGAPQKSDSGAGYNATYDVWVYDGGRYLRFQDGLLVDYR